MKPARQRSATALTLTLPVAASMQAGVLRRLNIDEANRRHAIA